MKLFLTKLFVIITLPFFTGSFSSENSNTDNDKITICHLPPGNIGNMQKITIDKSALQAHLDHGDRICGQDQ